MFILLGVSLLDDNKKEMVFYNGHKIMINDAYDFVADGIRMAVSSFSGA